MIKEIERKAPSGIAMLVLLLAVEAVAIWRVVIEAEAAVPLRIVVWVLVGLAAFVGLLGLFIVNPNEAKVLQLFGHYVGTVHEPGLRWANPFYQKRKVSRRVRNFETGKLKVNDHDGNPIEIAAVVVWKVTDTAEAAERVLDRIKRFGE